jgi:hypothetical protein
MAPGDDIASSATSASLPSLSAPSSTAQTDSEIRSSAFVAALVVDVVGAMESRLAMEEVLEQEKKAKGELKSPVRRA